MPKANINPNYDERIQCGHIAPKTARQIHEASLEILSRTGARFYLPKAVKLLRKAGAAVTDGNRVRIPAKLVEWALRTASHSVTLYSRLGQPAVRLEGFNSYYGTGSDCLNILDHRTNQRRKPVLQDVVEGTRMCNALPNIDFVMSMFLPQDVNQMVSDRYQMETMLNNTTKPIVFVTPEFSGTADAVEMAEAVAGDATALRQKPFVACYINVTTGLRQNEEALQKLIFLSKKGLPYTYIPVTQGGMTSPVTMAGSFISMNAGMLAGLVIAQLTREGTPFIVPGQGGESLDMLTMVAPYGAPDDRTLCRAMGHYYKLPIFGLAGCSDAKVVDQQAAAEAALTLMADTIGGANLIHDLGYLESGLCGSLAQLAICDEIVGWLRHFMAPPKVTAETLAVDLIDKVGPDGGFTETDHTFKHYRERYYPKLFERGNYPHWVKNGSKTMAERAAERVSQLLAQHSCEPLPAKAAKAVSAIVERAKKQLG